MKKLVFGLFATVLLVMILPLGASGAPQKHLEASLTFADPPTCQNVGHVNVQKTTQGWTLGLVDQTNQHHDPPTGQCQFTSGWAAGYFPGTVNLPAGVFRMNPGLSHAELSVTIPVFHFIGDHDLGFNTLMPIHLAWDATGPRIRTANGVSRAADVNGTIATCGDSPGNPCEPGGGCSTPPPCTRTDIQAVSSFVGARGVLQG